LMVALPRSHVSYMVYVPTDAKLMICNELHVGVTSCLLAGVNGKRRRRLPDAAVDTCLAVLTRLPSCRPYEAGSSNPYFSGSFAMRAAAIIFGT
jgi:hypothetical protein